MICNKLWEHYKSYQLFKINWLHMLCQIEFGWNPSGLWDESRVQCFAMAGRRTNCRESAPLCFQPVRGEQTFTLFDFSMLLSMPRIVSRGSKVFGTISNCNPIKWQRGHCIINNSYISDYMIYIIYDECSVISYPTFMYHNLYHQ